MKNADMPAMPMFDVEANPCRVRNPDTGEIARAAGLTKREMMAMHIASGFAADHQITTDNVVKWSIEVADKLLAELEKQQ